MSNAPLIVGVSGLRGIVGESLTPEVVVRYAGAFGAWLNERAFGTPRVLVCRDGRMGGGVFLDAASAGLRGVGCDVIDCGVLMTPCAGFLAAERECEGAIIVTASHNPQQWNGLKCLVVEGFEASAPDAAMATSIIERFESGAVGYVTDPGEIGYRDTVDPDIYELHAVEVADAMAEFGWGEVGDRVGLRRVVMDSVNSSGVRGSARLMSLLGIDVVQLHGDDNGVFPHTPEPTAENLSGEGGLCDAVPGLKADVGFAQDPDADRLAIVDENGRYIGEEYTLVLCAESVLSAREGGQERQAGRLSHQDGGDGKEPLLVANLSTSRMIDDVAAKYGGRVVRTPVGEANVVEVMKRLKAEGEDVVLGGEGNGGVIWPEVVYVRDSLSSMALVLSLMARTGKTVSELVKQIDSYSPGGKGYAIVKRKTAIASKADAGPAVEKVAEYYGGGEGDRRDACPTVDLQDGVRVDFPQRGVWVHVRASNTEPIMRLIAEAPTRDEADAVLDEVERVIAGG